MSMFPGAGARVYYNEAGEATGWDYPSYDDPVDRWDNEANPYEDDPDDPDPDEYVTVDDAKKCPYCGDTRLRFNPRPSGRYDEGELFVCEGCGDGGETALMDVA